MESSRSTPIKYFENIFLAIFGLALLFAMSISGLFTLWFTDTFDNFIITKMVLQEDSQSFRGWSKPSVRPLHYFSIFNYTNVEDYELKKADKLHVNEIGPYVYEETSEKINYIFNGTSLSYQIKKSFKFMPELSKGHEADMLLVPNLPFLAAAAGAKTSTFFARVGLSSFFNSIKAKPFISLSAKQFLVGYEDSLYYWSKKLLRLQHQQPTELFGLLAQSAGVSKDIYTINTGAENIKFLGQFEAVNGESHLDYWLTNKCNNIFGTTDGAFFSIEKVQNRSPLNVFPSELCRPITMYFDKDLMLLDGLVPAVKYKLSTQVFASPDNCPSNQCFCAADIGECPLSGLFNITRCANGAPIFFSLLHFHNADPDLRKNVTGLRENLTDEEVESYVSVHPKLGYVITGKTSLQLNVQILKSYGISQLNNYQDKLFLPVSSMDIRLQEEFLPQDYIDMIYLTSITIPMLETGLKYGTVLLSIVTFLGLIILLRKRWIHTKIKNQIEENA